MQPTKETILDRINETKREEIATLKARYRSGTSRELAEQCADLPPTRGFKRVISGQWAVGSASRPTDESGVVSSLATDHYSLTTKLIAEVKKASPSKGVIRTNFDPVAIAQAYERGGASCLSVLTDETYFQGSLSYLAMIREAVSLPLLRKDFILDPIQIYEARLAGADAVLLIVASVPSAARLAELRHVAESLGMDALVEVHNEAEVAIAVESDASLIGINNRDLHTFSVSLDVAARLIPLLPKGTVAVAESGIFTHEDIQTVAKHGAHAVLVGESLMRQENVEAATKKLLGRF